MRIKTYIKQAWVLLKQNKLFSTLYVAGTGLAIAMTMIMAVIYYVKLAPVYPEVNRLHTYSISSAGSTDGRSTYNSSLSYQALQDWALGVQNAEVASACLQSDFAESCYIQPESRTGDFHPITRLVDPAFFRIYEFRFLDGKPFTQSDLASGIRTAVITDDLSRRLFGTVQGVVGRTFSLNFMAFRVAGVVRSGSYLTRDSYAQLYLPYSIIPDYDKPLTARFPYVGQFEVIYLVKDAAQGKALQAEVQDIQRRVNLEHEGEWQLDLWQQPRSHSRKVFQRFVNEEWNAWTIVRQLGLVVLVLLLVPALNLSGMIASRMESRLSEMGVRKSFGAGRSRLLGQVMWENLLLTLLGGVLGLVLAWLMLYGCRSWLFTLMDDYASAIPEGAQAYVSGEMLFAPLVFACALLVCVLLNLLSALVPAWMSLRKPIVYSLYERR